MSDECLTRLRSSANLTIMFDDPVKVTGVIERDDKEAFSSLARANKLTVSEALARLVAHALKTGKIPK